MKIKYFIIFICLFLFKTTALSQAQAFIFTLYGGLYIPSKVDFKDNFKSSSDIIWGGGIGLPLSPTLFATSDLSYFHAKGLIDQSTDSTLKLEERFVHIGVLNKQPLTGNFFIRLSGGISYTTIKQKSSSAVTSEKEIEADKKLGYYGGLGIEQPLDSEYHTSIYADCLYDYRRSDRKELYGDFGGIRIILGVHLFLF